MLGAIKMIYQMDGIKSWERVFENKISYYLYSFYKLITTGKKEFNASIVKDSDIKQLLTNIFVVC